MAPHLHCRCFSVTADFYVRPRDRTTLLSSQSLALIYMNIRSSRECGLYVARRNVTRAGRLAFTRSLEFNDEEASYRVCRWCRRPDGRFRGLCRRRRGEVKILDGCRAIPDCHATLDRHQRAIPPSPLAWPSPSPLAPPSLPAVLRKLQLLCPAPVRLLRSSPLLRRWPRRHVQLRQRRLSRLVKGRSDETRKPASHAGFFRCRSIDRNSYNSR